MIDEELYGLLIDHLGIICLHLCLMVLYIGMFKRILFQILIQYHLKLFESIIEYTLNIILTLCYIHIFLFIGYKTLQQMDNNDILILMNDDDSQMLWDYTIDSTIGTDKDAQTQKRKRLKKKQTSYDQLYLPDVGKKVLTSTEVHSDEEEGFEISIERTRVGRNTSHAPRKHISHRIRVDRRSHQTLQDLTSHVVCNIRNCKNCREMPYYENPPAKSVCSLFKNCINNTENTKLMDNNDYVKYLKNIDKMKFYDNYLFGVEKSGM